jgi:hypothetical protein
MTDKLVELVAKHHFIYRKEVNVAFAEAFDNKKWDDDPLIKSTCLEWAQSLFALLQSHGVRVLDEDQTAPKIEPINYNYEDINQAISDNITNVKRIYRESGFVRVTKIWWRNR